MLDIAFLWLLDCLQSATAVFHGQGEKQAFAYCLLALIAGVGLADDWSFFRELVEPWARGQGEGDDDKCRGRRCAARHRFEVLIIGFQLFVRWPGRTTPGIVVQGPDRETKPRWVCSPSSDYWGSPPC